MLNHCQQYFKSDNSQAHKMCHKSKKRRQYNVQAIIDIDANNSQQNTTHKS